MSGYDSNPFSDPRVQPYSSSDPNPFSDASVQQAARTSGKHGTLDDYNPFAETNQPRPVNQGPGTSSPTPQPASTKPAIMVPSEPPPPYTQPAAQMVDTRELQRQQEELEKKAAELQRKEQEMKNAQLSGKRVNNFPPLPSFCPVGPCFYQDISVEIPLEHQRLVKLSFILWGVHAFVLFFNVIGSLAFYIVDSDGGTTFGLSILWLILFIPSSFIFWYRPLYKAFRSDSSFSFFVFFFNFFAQFCVLVIQALGFTGFTVGWINGIYIATNDSVAVGALILVIAFIETVEAVLILLLLVAVHRIYRSSGASFQKAQAEFSTGVINNQSVRDAASDAASGAARNTMSGYREEIRY